MNCRGFSSPRSSSRSWQILALAVCASIAALVGAPAVPVSAAGAIHCVALTGGATAAPCVNSIAYTSIQAAVTAAKSGDEIRIASGTYTRNNLSVVSIEDKSLALRGGYAPVNWQSPSLPGATIIDGQTKWPGVFVFGDSTVTLERLTITRGRNATGGGVEANLLAGRTLTLIDMVISHNVVSGSGGGLFVGGGNTVMTRTQILDNTATEDGGGFYGLRLTAIDSIVSRNTATRNAGGIGVVYASIENARIENNMASNGNGGGMYVSASLSGGTLAMTRTQILDNHAGGRGGALYLANLSGAQIGWSLLANNQASDGDALAVDPNSSDDSQITLANVTIASTSLSPHAAINLGAFNPAAPMSLSLTNTVVTSHTTGIVRPSNVSLSGDYNVFFNNGTNQMLDGNAVALPFAHLLATDPQFVEPGAKDFHLRATSPLRDAGDPSLSYANQRDLDGIAVPIGPTADIGAYEYILRSERIYVPLSVR